MKERQFPLRIKTCFRGHELENGQLVQRKAMALRHKTKLPFAFREGDIKACLPAATAVQQELQRKGGLSGAGLPLDQIQPFRVNTTAQDVVQPWNASRNPVLDVCCKVLLIHRADGLLRILPISARNTSHTILRLFRAPVLGAVLLPRGTENPRSKPILWRLKTLILPRLKCPVRGRVPEPWQMMPGRATGALLNEMVSRVGKETILLFRVFCFGLARVAPLSFGAAARP